jgi:prepilin-type N-terminal cleavage/methylation domain-containing protein
MKILKNTISNLKHGFTLAEVLITLVIIGVVAALTIPAAINKYKDEELKSQFKKAYSTISQAFYKTQMYDFFGYSKCYYGEGGIGTAVSECPAFYEALAKNLSIQKNCRGNSLADGCIPGYQTYATSSGNVGYNQDYIENRNNTWVLSDGQILIPYYYASNGAMPVFLVDINGHKGPNGYGKDLFGFRIKRNADTGVFLIPENDAGIALVPGGKQASEMLQYCLAGKK